MNETLLPSEGRSITARYLAPGSGERENLTIRKGSTYILMTVEVELESKKLSVLEKYTYFQVK